MSEPPTIHEVPVTLRHLDGSTETLRVPPDIATELVDAVRCGDVVTFETDDGVAHTVRGDAMFSVHLPAQMAWWELSAAIGSRRDWPEETWELGGAEPSRNAELRSAYPTAVYFRGLASRPPAAMLRAADILAHHCVPFTQVQTGAAMPDQLDPPGGYLAILAVGDDDATLRMHRVEEPAQTTFVVDDESQAFLEYLDILNDEDGRAKAEAVKALWSRGWTLTSEWELHPDGDEWVKVQRAA